MKYKKLYHNTTDLPKYQGGGGASGAGAAHGRKNQPKVEVPEPEPTFWDHVKDVGEFGLNQTLTPFETIVGVNFYDPEFESDFMQDASDITAGIQSAATDIAGTALLGPVYTKGKAAIQTGVSAAGLDEKWDATHSGHNAWSDKTGQTIAAVGSFGSAFVQRGGNINNETMAKRNNLSEYMMKYGGHPKRYAYGGHPKRYQLMGDVNPDTSTETFDPLSSLKESVFTTPDTTSESTLPPVEGKITPSTEGSEISSLTDTLSSTAIQEGGQKALTSAAARAGLPRIAAGLGAAGAGASLGAFGYETIKRYGDELPGMGENTERAGGGNITVGDLAEHSGLLGMGSMKQTGGRIKAQTGFDPSMFSVSGDAAGLPMANMSDAATGIAYGAEGETALGMTLGNTMRLGGGSPMGGGSNPMQTMFNQSQLGQGLGNMQNQLSGLGAKLGIGGGGGSGGGGMGLGTVTDAIGTGKEIFDIWKNPTKSEQLAQQEEDVENKGLMLAKMQMKNVQENVIGGPALKQSTAGNVTPGSFLVQRGGSIGRYQDKGAVDPRFAQQYQLASPEAREAGWIYTANAKHTKNWPTTSKSSEIHDAVVQYLDQHGANENYSKYRNKVKNIATEHPNLFAKNNPNPYDYDALKKDYIPEEKLIGAEKYFKELGFTPAEIKAFQKDLSDYTGIDSFKFKEGEEKEFEDGILGVNTLRAFQEAKYDRTNEVFNIAEQNWGNPAAGWFLKGGTHRTPSVPPQKATESSTIESNLASGIIKDTTRSYQGGGNLMRGLAVGPAGMLSDAILGKGTTNSMINKLVPGLGTAVGAISQNGGPTDKIDIEVEGGETISTIDGENNKFMGPSHDQGGIITTANEGDFVYPKGTWANRHKKRTEREAAILEKLENAGINTDELV